MMKSDLEQPACKAIVGMLLISVLVDPAQTMAHSGLYSNLAIPDRPSRAYISLGDINLGGLISVSDTSLGSSCGDRIRVPMLQELVEAIVFAVKKINDDGVILPNVHLGFALLDDCSKQSISAAQALRFLPRIRKGNLRELWNDTSEERDGFEYYDVVGVIGPIRSANSQVVSFVLGPAQIPQISFLSTSDVLSRKNIHPYFLRVVPPDAHQMKAILEFISLNGWTYFSVLYSEGSYGEPAYEVIKKSIKGTPMCIAAHHKIYSDMTTNEYKQIILNLDSNERARVVILITGDEKMRKIFQTVNAMKITKGRFIWIGTDGWAERVSSLESSYRQDAIGSFTTTFYAPPAEDFTSYFRKLKPSCSNNPWFHEFWERMFNCSFKAKTCDESLDIATSTDYYVMSQAVYGIDTVYAYAYALHNLLRDRCPVARGVAARDCVNGPLLLEYLKNVSFNGYTGNVSFDQFSDRLGQYVIKQILPGKMLYQREVIIVNAQHFYTLHIVNNMTWDYVERFKSDFGPNARFQFPAGMDSLRDKKTPISVCSRLCEVGERKIEREPSCCWDCRSCRGNEKLVLGFTACEQCPKFTWPDESTNFTKCTPIQPTYLMVSEPIVIIIMCFSIAGIVFTAIIVIIFVQHRESRIIKASGRELSFVQLGAILFGYMAAIIYTMRPSNTLCVVKFFLYCLSFSSLYSPLLIKTIRIYRIFDSANKGRRTLKGVDPFLQIVLTSCLIFGQIMTCFVVTVTCKPMARLASPSRAEKYVELYCDLTDSGLLSFVSYNLTLVCLCALFAFKTRKLPDNFNESRFISMCVFTTLVLWLAMVPSFLTESRKYMQSILLAIGLLFNHSVSLVFLFVSRVYAIYYVDESMISEADGHGFCISTFRVRSKTCITPVNLTSKTCVTPSSGNHLKAGSSQ